MKGQKTGGRQVGTPNKVTKELRERFKEFAEGNFDNCQEWLDRVADEDPAEALRLYLALTERVIGKLSSQQIDHTSGGDKIPAPIIQLPNSGTIPETGGGVDAPDRQADN